MAKKIKMIQVLISEHNKVYGLGDDNKMYRWNTGLVEWVLWKADPPTPAKSPQPPQDPKKQSLDDSARREATKVDFKGMSVRQMLKNS